MNRVSQLPHKASAPTGRVRRTLPRLAGTALIHVVVAGAAVAIGLPFFYMITTSLKTFGEVYRVPMVLFPENLQWVNYAQVWGLVPFARFTLNSLIFTCFTTLGRFFLGLTCGYAFARLAFPGRDKIFFVVLLTYMIPGHITLIPRFIMLSELSWINTYQGLIVPHLAATFATFMFREYFRTLPDELFDAAEMDGAGYFRQLFQLALPMSKSVAVTLLLLEFVAHWNAYMWPLVVTNTRNMRTLPIGVQSLRDVMGFPEWQLVMAGATIVVLPLVVLFVFVQRQFIEGMVEGAVKG